MKDYIDEKDKKILEILQENSSLSSYKISKTTLIPVTTVNNRIKKLKKLRVIKKFTVDIDKKKLGLNLAVYIFITLSRRELKEEGMKTKDLIRLIKKNPFVDTVENITGDTDVVVKMHLKDIGDLNDYVVNVLSDLRGIEKTRTAIVLEHE